MDSWCADHRRHHQPKRIAKLVASAARWQPSSSFGTLGEFLAGNLHRLLHDGIAAIGSEVEKGFEHLLTARARIECRIDVDTQRGFRSLGRDRSQGRAGRQLAGLGIDAWSWENVAIRVLDEHPT